MVSKLEVYNLALIQMKASPLSALTERTESRRVLDALWDTVTAEMLENGFWKFAIRSVKIEPDTATSSAFGYSYAFNLPGDWVRTYALSSSESLAPFLHDWIEESGFFFANVTPIYVRYVSNNDANYGMYMQRWTKRFTKALAFQLAWRASPKATGSSDSFNQKLEGDALKALADARAFEALREPTKRLPEGNWNSSRFGRRLGDSRF